MHAIENDRRLIRDARRLEQRLETAKDLTPRNTVECLAAAREAARRTLGVRSFDVQLLGALAMASGRVAEMQTGEGKTLAAVPAVVALCLAGRRVHVMTANDYLARRDAAWMGPVYDALGVRVGCVQQGMSTRDRRRAYAADVTYGSATEIGFDFLRDRLAASPDDVVQPAPDALIVDELDSILIDEARAPLVIAGGEAAPDKYARAAAEAVRHFEEGLHYVVDQDDRVGLRGEPPAELPVNAVLLAVRAKALARRDVEYIVRDGRIELVDEFKGRTDPLRRWPGGFHTAVEAKEGLELTQDARILGSITLQSLVRLSRACPA